MCANRARDGKISHSRAPSACNHGSHIHTASAAVRIICAHPCRLRELLCCGPGADLPAGLGRLPEPRGLGVVPMPRLPAQVVRHPAGVKGMAGASMGHGRRRERAVIREWGIGRELAASLAECAARRFHCEESDLPLREIHAHRVSLAHG